MVLCGWLWLCVSLVIVSSFVFACVCRVWIREVVCVMTGGI